MLQTGSELRSFIIYMYIFYLQVHVFGVLPKKHILHQFSDLCFSSWPPGEEPYIIMYQQNSVYSI